MKIANPEQKMEGGNLFDVKASKLFKANDSQASVARIQFADLNIGTVYLVRMIRFVGQAAVSMVSQSL